MRRSLHKEIVDDGEMPGLQMGFRVFRYAVGRAKIMSAFYHFEWWPGRSHESARCSTLTVAGCMTPPAAAHSCGFYAFYDISHARGAYTSLWQSQRTCIPLLGLVAAWGNIIDCEHGFRSERMEIIAFRRPPAHPPQLDTKLSSGTFNTPYVLLEGDEALVACAESYETDLIMNEVGGGERSE